MAAQAASCVFIYGLPYLLPALRHAFGLSLGSASLLITCPMFGVVLALLAEAALTVSTNGLAFTAVAEIAGMSWAGRALGVQNTAQNIAAAATPPVMAQLITSAGYPGTFWITALFPIAAAAAIPAPARATVAPTAQRAGKPVTVCNRVTAVPLDTFDHVFD